MLQRPIYAKSVDSGESWTLGDALDRPIRSWDGRGLAVRRRYDALGRPTHVFVSKDGKAESLVERTLYGESHPEGETLNLRGRTHLQFDGAGVASSLRYNLDGNLVHSSRRVAAAYDTDPDWSVLTNATTPAEALALAAPLLEGEMYSLESSYDALGRIVWQKVARGAEMRFSYHESNHLRALELKTVGALWTSILVDSDYNARGQRTRLDYGSGIRSHFTWDVNTFRVRRIHSVRTADSKVLQDLRYVYDAAGNIVEQADEAQQDLYSSNTVVSPLGRYRYDALYHLVEAKGREHPGQQHGSGDLPWSTIPHANTTNALIRYTERYTHDAVGNILQMKHPAGSSGWTRNYRYNTTSNRLLSTSLPGDPQGGPYSATYTYDAAGNMTSMPHLSSMRWDWAQRLKATSRGGGGDVFYTYDASGQRVRKHYRHAYADDRVYIGPWEIERRHSGSSLQTERLTIHLFDGDRRLAIVEVLTQADGKPVLNPPPRYRYQLPNHLESSCIETDELGRLITYEEYHPFGTTSFRAIGVTPIGLSLKRYRYTGMERDEETSLAYHSARYYAPWLGRWTSPDPLGMVDGTNLYQYSGGNPAVFSDPSGLQSQAEQAIDDADAERDHPPPPAVPPYRRSYISSSDQVTNKAISNMWSNTRLRDRLEELEYRRVAIIIEAVSDDDVTLHKDLYVDGGARMFVGEDGSLRIKYNLNLANRIAAEEGRQALTLEELLAHELGHAEVAAEDIWTIRADEKDGSNPSTTPYTQWKEHWKKAIIQSTKQGWGDQRALEWEADARRPSPASTAPLKHAAGSPAQQANRLLLWMFESNRLRYDRFH